MPLPPLSLAPTPPELPTVPAVVPEQPAHIPNDARLTQWVADLSRSLKDAWVRLNSSVGGLESALSGQAGSIAALDQRVTAVETRVTTLETRIADTYVFAQPGAVSATPVGEPPLAPLVGLPLRAVRAEILVEAALALGTAAGAPGLALALEHNAVQIATGVLAPGQTFALFPLSVPRPLAANDILAVRVLQIGDAPQTGADLVVQLRAR
jgi:hypothetical protein